MSTRHFVLVAESPLRGVEYTFFTFCVLPLDARELTHLLGLRDGLVRSRRVIEVLLKGGKASWYSSSALPKGVSWDDGVIRHRYLELPAADLADLDGLEPDSVGEESELVLTSAGLAVQHQHSDSLGDLWDPVRTFMVPWRVLRAGAARRKSELP